MASRDKLFAAEGCYFQEGTEVHLIEDRGKIELPDGRKIRAALFGGTRESEGPPNEILPAGETYRTERLCSWGDVYPLEVFEESEGPSFKDMQIRLGLAYLAFIVLSIIFGTVFS